MRIAVASMGADINSQISPQAGRAPYYLIFNNGELEEVWENPFTVGGGAGMGVAQVMAGKSVNKLIAGNIGQNMGAMLAQHGIAAEIRGGVVKDAVL